MCAVAVQSERDARDELGVRKLEKKTLRNKIDLSVVGPFGQQLALLPGVGVVLAGAADVTADQAESHFQEKTSAVWIQPVLYKTCLNRFQDFGTRRRLFK